jgi:hydrogenase nickel incorporation protein HypA/HybF
VHEMSIMQSVVESVTERLPDAKVVGIRLEIGQLTGIVVDSVRFCFELITDGTSLQGATLVIDQPVGLFRCRRCDTLFEHGDLVGVCACGSTEVTVVGGQELRIKSVNVAAEVS